MIQLMMSHMVQSREGCRRATTMRGAGAASRKLSICLILLFGCPGLQAVSSPSNMSLQSTLLDLNRTVFINTIVLNTTSGNHDYIDVDVGTESCDLFDDKACYITCSSRKLVQNTAYYVTTNVTCDVSNAKGRYVRLRQNTTTGLPGPCDVKVTGWLDLGKDFKNFALNAPCVQSTNHWTPNKAVDGNRNGYFFNNSCTHTILFNNFQQRHWWQVDLRKLIFVSHIIIANRLDCCGDRLANFTVELGRLESNGSITYTLCRYHDGVAGPLTTLNCTRSIWGRFVRISLMGVALTLCEVEVYGDMDDNSTRLVPVILTSPICDDEPGTSLSPSTMRTWTMKPTQGTTEAKVSQTFVDITSKVSGNLNAKVSTMYSVTTTKSQVSTEFPGLTTKAEVSTMTQDITTKAEASTMNPTVVTETKLSAEQSHEAQITTATPQITTATPEKYNYCACKFCNKTTKSQDEVDQKIKQTTKSLKVNNSALGKQVRKKCSASDHRVSATAMGIIGTTVLSFIFLVIVLCDVYGLCQYLFKKKKEKRRKQ